MYEVWSPSGEQIHRSGAQTPLPPVSLAATGTPYRYETIIANGERSRTIAAPLTIGGHNVVPRVSRSEERVREELAEVLVVLVLGLPLVVALAGVGGYLLARRGLAPIDHLASEAQRITVTANVSGRDLGSVVEEVQNAVAARVQLPTGYRIGYSGRFESSQQAPSLLLWLSIPVVIAMFFILAAACASSSLAALIMVNLPLALIGGIAGVFVSGGVPSIASIIGLIALLGIAARNGIMLVSHIEYLRHEEGLTDLRHAIVQGSIDRVVPILMTAPCTALALVPVALGAGEPGSEIQAAEWRVSSSSA